MLPQGQAMPAEGMPAEGRVTMAEASRSQIGARDGEIWRCRARRKRGRWRARSMAGAAGLSSRGVAGDSQGRATLGIASPGMRDLERLANS